jgi:hypothetical protein
MCGVDPLYVVLPYFNYCGFQKRRTLFIEFVKRISVNPWIKIVVVEMGKDLPSLPVSVHHRITQGKPVWIKENLVNVAVERLPDTWKYMAWIDADITFLNRHWARETVHELKSHDVVQLFQSAVNMGPDGEALKLDTSFVHKYLSGSKYHKTDKYGHWHPGYAWACTNKAWNQMGGLVDWAILGSGDRHLAMSLIGKVHDSYHGGVHENYKMLLDAFQSRCHGLTLGCVKGTIIHHWHGSLTNRKYRERWLVLVDTKYDPLIDIGLDTNGVLRLTKDGNRLEQPLKDYFVGRDEDS